MSSTSLPAPAAVLVSAVAGAAAGAAIAALLLRKKCVAEDSCASKDDDSHASEDLAAREAEVSKHLHAAKIIPVVAVPSADLAVPLAEALVAGGLPVVEVVFRTDAAEESLRRMAARVPGAILGAGTILSPAQAAKAVDAGARFIVSPGLNPEVVHWCRAQGIPVIPGVATPTEIEAAMGLGLSMMKFFPAEANGGAVALKAICAPYAGLRFMPTGGVSEKNLETYMKIPQVVACGGTWMVPADKVSGRQFAEITEISKRAKALAISISEEQ